MSTVPYITSPYFSCHYCHIHTSYRDTFTVPDTAKTILQMPRGNLEAFEPRPLLLLRAREMLNRRDFFGCLLLLRRQKVDLNLLVDYHPVLFLQEVGPLVHQALNANSEMLSLLISALKHGDSTTERYRSTPWISSYDSRDPSRLPSPDFYEGPNPSKLNVVCVALREVLLPALRDLGHQSALLPLLCTFATQRPPLLAEALQLIRDSATSGPGQPVRLSSPQ